MLEACAILLARTAGAAQLMQAVAAGPSCLCVIPAALPRRYATPMLARRLTRHAAAAPLTGMFPYDRQSPQQHPMNAIDHLVFIVDDDFRVREALQSLLESEGMAAVAFATAAEYLAYARPDVASCLVLDVELPDVSGLDLQQRIAGGLHPRIVFITGHGDVPRSVRALKGGAVDFLTKPFSDQQFLGAVREAIDQDRLQRQARAELTQVQRRHERLSPREREVLPLVVSGLLNKQAAALLGISEITLQIHRSKIMSKMEADSLPDLVRMADLLGVQPTYSRRARP